MTLVALVVSQLSKLWRNDSGSTGKQKTFKRNLEADVT